MVYNQTWSIYIIYWVGVPRSQTKAYNQMIWYGFNMADTSNPPLYPSLLCKLTKYSPVHHEASVNVKYHNYDTLPLNIILKSFDYWKSFFTTFPATMKTSLKEQIFVELNLFWGQKAITLEFWFNEHNFSANTNILTNTKCKINV